MKNGVLYIVLMIILSSCGATLVDKTHRYYFQNPHQVPLFKEKNEARFSGGLSTGIDNSGGQLQTAYSITNKLAIQANWFKNHDKFGAGGSWEANYYDLALGYYKDFEKFGIFEFYGGVGYLKQTHNYFIIHTETINSFWFGTYTNDSYVPVGSATFHANKIYFQPSYGFTFNSFDVVLSSRFSSLNFMSVDNNVTPGNYRYNEAKSFTYGNSYIFFEPAITIRAGWKYFKGQVQIAFNGTAGIRSSPTNVSVGVNFAFAKRYNDVVKKEEQVQSQSYIME